jgi:hypothetical protein
LRRSGLQASLQQSPCVITSQHDVSQNGTHFRPAITFDVVVKSRKIVLREFSKSIGLIDEQFLDLIRHIHCASAGFFLAAVNRGSEVSDSAKDFGSGNWHEM